MSTRGRKHLNLFLSSNGDGTGTTEAIGDYSVTPLSLKLIPDNTSLVELHGLKMNLRDTGTFTAGDFGSINGGLTVGIRVYVRDGDDNILEELTTLPVKNNADLASFATFRKNEFDTNDNVISIVWGIGSYGEPVKVDFSKGEYFEVYLNDNFTGLTDHSWIIYGYYPHEYYS